MDYAEVLSKSQTSGDLTALAVFSARKWEFTPARTKEGAAPGEVVLHYRFGLGLRASARSDSVTRQ